MNVFKCHKCGAKASVEQSGESKVRICMVCQSSFKPLRIHPDDFAIIEAAFVARSRMEKNQAETVLQDAIDRGEQQKKLLLAQN